MANKLLVIVRAIPGRGKSTWIEKNYPDAAICSADLFFTDKDGNYNFDPSLIGAAHNFCMEEFLYAVEREEPVIVIDNTNCCLWEYAKFKIAARLFGYEVKVVELVTDTKEQALECARRGTHGVPEHIVLALFDLFEDDPLTADRVPFEG